MKIYIQTNNATTNLFGFHNQPHKTTRSTKKLKLAWGEGAKKKSRARINLKIIYIGPKRLLEKWKI